MAQGKQSTAAVWLRSHRPAGFLALLFAVCFIVGMVMQSSISASRIDTAYLVSLAFRFLLAFVVLFLLIGLVQDRIEASRYMNEGSAGTSFSAGKKPSKVHRLFDTHPLLVPFVALIICWLPYLIICYPGTTDPYDTLDQLQQFFGMPAATATNVNLVNPDIYLNNHHPVFDTVLLGLFIRFGMITGSQNIGLFLFVLMQTAIFAFALAWTVALQKDFGMPLAVRIISLCIFCFAPLFSGWTVCVTKDTLFTVFVVLYTVLMVRIVFDPKRYRAFKDYAVLFLVALLMCLLRNNGVFIVAFTAPFLLLSREKGLKRCGVTALSVAAVYALYVMALLPALGISSGSVRESLSVPIQQAAYLAYSEPEDFTAEQWEAINAPFDTDNNNIGEYYDPILADAVKNNYRKDTTSQQLKDFLTAWAQLGLKHPLQYAAATLKNTFGYFYPGANTAWIWPEIACWGFGPGEGLVDDYHASGFYFEQNPAFEDAREGIDAFFKAYSSSPFGLVTNMAVSAWLLLTAAVLMRHPVCWRNTDGSVAEVRRARKRMLIPFIPSFVLLAVCFAGPLNGSVRYALPYISVTPLLVTYAVYCARDARRCRESLDGESSAADANAPRSCDNA